MTFGDMPVDFEEPQFTHGEAVEITGVASKALNNWTQREVVDLGKMHRTGRRLYSIHDLMELKIVGELAEMVQMAPGQAAAAAKWARQRSFQMSERDGNGNLLYKGQSKEQRHYLTIWFDGGSHRIKLEQGGDWFSKGSFPHPFIVVPLDDIVLRVANRAFEVLEREFKKSGGGE